MKWKDSQKARRAGMSVETKNCQTLAKSGRHVIRRIAAKGWKQRKSKKISS